MGTSAPAPGWCVLVLVLLLDTCGVGGQDFQVLQPKDPVSVSAGDMLALNCTVPQRGPAGPVKWFKGSGSDRQLLYAETGSLPRVTRAAPASPTDFSINISDVRPEDAGTYYCVKFTKGSPDEEYRSGAGTVVSVSGVGGQDFQVLQPKDPVSVSAGDTLTLNCTIPQRGPAGPMKWFKGSGSDRQLVYAETGSLPRVTRAAPGSVSDFSINISDTRPEDAGTYYCVKFRKGSPDEEYRSGAGTVVSVSASPSAPSVSGPASRVEPGRPVNFTCTSKGLSPGDIAVTWLKDGVKLPVQPLQILPENERDSYRVSSTLARTLTVRDIRSQLTCQIEHSTMSAPLRGTYKLSQALRVSPRPRLAANYSGAVPVNEMVALTCSLAGFYPNAARLTWMENGKETQPEKSPSPTENRDGTFSLTGTLEVRATEQKNQSAFTCRAVHDSQAPTSVTRVLAVTATSAQMEEGPQAGQCVLSSPGLWVGYVLEKGLIGAFLFFLFVRRKEP
ncbi:signal-regulatory protein beta-1-like [Alligator mississippiensis]|uniref:signal-regulatory protein beta-1-like n=1 Tax=Alligator mississippiensis TaxID=8496 RepID=UPI002877F8AD|nr:signal-regulatory protein beta-1-like [Alligator mississippiensis]